MSVIIDPFAKQKEAVVFTPGMRAKDPAANFWLRQATLRLRREIAWRWRLRSANGPPRMDALPPLEDRLTASLDLTRYQDSRRAFFREDVTAHYLSQKLDEEPAPESSPRGGFGWAIQELGLDDVSAFTLALGIMPCFDSASGPVMAACMNDSARPHPTLALVQRLWDEPDEILNLANSSHPMWRLGLLRVGQHPGAAIELDEPYHVPAIIADQLLFPSEHQSDILKPVRLYIEGDAIDTAPYLASRLRGSANDGLRIVPVQGVRRADFAGAAGSVTAKSGRTLCRFPSLNDCADGSAEFRSIATFAWLRDADLLLDLEQTTSPDSEQRKPYAYLETARSIPITVFVPVESGLALTHLPESLILPTIHAPSLDYAGRLRAWRRYLRTSSEPSTGMVEECARRFRFERETIRAICEAMDGREQIGQEDLIAACRAEYSPELGSLAQPVTPRFDPGELVLPEKQRTQFEEIYRATLALTTVHYGWGTARAWNESGISVLFAGPPGTGKTMAAETLCTLLNMPMYRIDLSQVVNKYIGETEKNLKRLFDAADISDSILFFDEADALFGRRTEVKDAHDRYANLEVSYLLERMERFKGLAILATNRRKDLDDAFLRRLRYVVEFPMPEAKQRREMWERMIPNSVDTSEVDFEFMARQFQLAGGHIRSVVFNACLQSADPGRPNETQRKLTMEKLIIAVRREFSKLGRSVSLEQFGKYAPLVEGLGDD